MIKFFRIIQRESDNQYLIQEKILFFWCCPPEETFLKHRYGEPPKRTQFTYKSIDNVSHREWEIMRRRQKEKRRKKFKVISISSIEL